MVATRPAGGNVAVQTKVAPASIAKPVTGARRDDAIGRYEHSYEVANGAVNAIGALSRGYIVARDGLNISSVAELGGQLIGMFGNVHGAMAALEQIRPTLLRKSIAGVDAAEGMDDVDRGDAIDREIPALKHRVERADSAIANALTLHQFRGHEVAGRPVVLELAETFEQQTATLTGELQRTIQILQTIHDLVAKLASSKHGLDRAAVDDARAQLVQWSGRPLDLAFIRAALGPLWNALDTAAGGPLLTPPSDLMTTASQQANDTGWLGDVGRFDIRTACEHLYAGGRNMAELVLGDLYTADPNTRAKLLMQIRERGLLDRLCSAVGWMQVKELHDSLGYGFPEIKHALQSYFIGDGKFGPTPDTEWNNHARSLHGTIGQYGSIGQGVNFALNLATFGFHGSYSQSLDERSLGVTSESESHNAKAHAAMLTAVTAIVATLTGGVADKAVRGGATTVSMGRAMTSGAVGGSVGAASTVATSDAYNNYITGTQHGMSSMKEYVTAMLVGGAFGAAFGGIAERSSRSDVGPEVSSGADFKGQFSNVELPPGTTVHRDKIVVIGMNGEPLTFLIKRGSGDAPATTHRNADGTFDITVGHNVPTDIANNQIAHQLREAAATPRQGVHDLDKLYSQASVAQQQLGELTRSVADEFRGAALIPEKLKGRDRAMEKINTDYEGEVGRVTDLGRSTIVFETPQQIEEAKARIGQRVQVVRVKDRFEAPQQGYRDVMMNLRMPNGHIVEIQLHLKAILDVKNGPGHALYEQIRSVNARVKSENRAPTPEERARIKQLNFEMKRLYDEAFEYSTLKEEANAAQSGGQEI